MYFIYPPAVTIRNRLPTAFSMEVYTLIMTQIKYHRKLVHQEETTMPTFRPWVLP